MKQRVLVVVAHPDDEVLGCGGTICRHAQSGDAVTIFILGEGLTARQPQRNTKKFTTALPRLKEQAKLAARCMGAKAILFGGLPDNRFDSLHFLDLVKHVEKVKVKVNPDVVYTHHAGDLNLDHRITHQAVCTAFRPLPNEKCKAIYSFEVLSSTEWQSSDAGTNFIAEHYVDITSYLPLKLKALAFYKGELRPFPHPRSPEAVEALARIAGSQAGLGAAERFRVVRSIWRSVTVQ